MENDPESSNTAFFVNRPWVSNCLVPRTDAERCYAHGPLRQPLAGSGSEGTGLSLGFRVDPSTFDETTFKSEGGFGQTLGQQIAARKSN